MGASKTAKIKRKVANGNIDFKLWMELGSASAGVRTDGRTVSRSG